jgi:hypothetical protein
MSHDAWQPDPPTPPDPRNRAWDPPGEARHPFVIILIAMGIVTVGLPLYAWISQGGRYGDKVAQLGAGWSAAVTLLILISRRTRGRLSYAPATPMRAINLDMWSCGGLLFATMVMHYAASDGLGPPRNSPIKPWRFADYGVWLGGVSFAVARFTPWQALMLIGATLFLSVPACCLAF